MKQIKTVIYPIEKAELFDLKINQLIYEGWMLNKREVIGIAGTPSESFNIPIVKSLYAELVR